MPVSSESPVRCHGVVRVAGWGIPAGREAGAEVVKRVLSVGHDTDSDSLRLEQGRHGPLLPGSDNGHEKPANPSHSRPNTDSESQPAASAESRCRRLAWVDYRLRQRASSLCNHSL